MLAQQSAVVQRKADLQPSTSLDSAQTAQTQQHAASPGSPPYADGSSNPSALQPACSLLPPAVSNGGRASIDPSAAKLAIKEALAPLSPAELAMVQEQLRQSRLARQQEAWGSVKVTDSVNFMSAQSCSLCPVPSTPEQAESGVNPLVQQVASALAHGKVLPQDISRVLNTLDPSVFLPAPKQQRQHQPLPQHVMPQLQKPQYQLQHSLQERPAWHARVNSAPSALTVPAAIPMPASPFYSSQLPPAITGHQHSRLGPRPAHRSVAAPYSAVLNSLQLPPSALAAHAAAATAADAACMQHPGTSARKGRRSSRRAREQLASLLKPVSSATGDAGHTASADPAPCQHQQAAGDLLMFMAGQPSADHAFHMDSTPAAAPSDMLLCTKPSADADWTAPSATPAAHEAGVDSAAPAAAAVAPMSLRARFARLPACVQEDILRQLDELSALEDETRGGNGASEPQGPRRSSRARKVRNLDDSNSLAAKGGARSASPTPPLSTVEDLQEQQPGRAVPKRMRLDASSHDHAGSGSPESSSRPLQEQQANSSPDAEMLRPLDLWVCPEPMQPSEDFAPRRRRIARKIGARASARKRMHRSTFKRGKPQRAPTA